MLALDGDDAQDAERPAATAPAVPDTGEATPALAIGITEQNPNLVVARGAGPSLSAPFSAARDRLAALRPAVYRVSVDWDKVQPSPDRAARFDRPESGCLRVTPPCAAYRGLRDRLGAAASQQRAGAGFAVLLVLQGTPAWAASAPAGCERPGTTPRSRPPRSSALPAYRRLIRAVIDLARREGAAIRWVSAWNEPNHPTFISPQRARCDVDSRALAPAAYARIARAAKAELDAVPGDQRLVIGELAGFPRPRPGGAGAVEFIRGLPRDVVCATDIWAQHGYVRREGAQGRSGLGGGVTPGADRLVGDVVEALDARDCAKEHHVWITETGVGGVRAGEPRSTDPGELRADCRAYHRSLRTWWRDPRVDVAVHYTFREDDTFPVGLMTTDLRRTYPTYDLLRAWAGDRDPGARPPQLPDACRASGA